MSKRYNKKETKYTIFPCGVNGWNFVGRVWLQQKDITHRNSSENKIGRLLKEAKFDFERQFLFGRRIFDFFLPKILMAIEVDGRFHDRKWDKLRDKYLLSEFGIRVFRLFTLKDNIDDQIRVMFSVLDTKYTIGSHQTNNQKLNYAKLISDRDMYVSKFLAMEDAKKEKTTKKKMWFSSTELGDVVKKGGKKTACQQKRNKKNKSLNKKWNRRKHFEIFLKEFENFNSMKPIAIPGLNYVSCRNQIVKREQQNLEGNGVEGGRF